MIFESRYHSHYMNAELPIRETHARSSVDDRATLVPTNAGVHLNLLVTQHEGTTCLVLKPFMRYDGNEIEMDLRRVL